MISARALVSRLLVLPFAFMTLSACAGVSGTAEQAGPSREERLALVDACEAVLENLRALDIEHATEGELQAGLEDAILSVDTCRDNYLAAAETPGEEVLLRHRAEQLQLTALLLEAQLSARFDGGAYRCEILRESFAVLYGGVRWLENALGEVELSPSEELRVIEQRNLDLQAIDVLVLDFTTNCGDYDLQVE